MVVKKVGLGLIALVISSSLLAYPGADLQGKVFHGLQGVHRVAKAMSLDPEQSLGTIGQQNTIQRHLAPWDETAVTAQFKEHSPIKTTALAIIEFTFRSPLFDTSGLQASKDEFTALVESTTFLESYDKAARGITLSDTDALFIPTENFLTNNLAEGSNTASNQKSSSTLITANTPVYILGQLSDIGNVNPDDGSWLLVWRPEMGPKFVRSRHIGHLSEEDINTYILHSEDLRITTTGRVQREAPGHNFSDVMAGTFFPRDESGNYLQALLQSHTGKTVPLASVGVTLQLRPAELVSVTLRSKDKAKPELGDHLKSLSPKPKANEYLDALHNQLLLFPPYAQGNIQKSFGWGEATVGIDQLRGQDISTFILKLVKPFGLWLPRFSVHQVERGHDINLIHTVPNPSKIDNSQANYQALLDHCTLGRMANFALNGHMACLGSVTVEQLSDLDAEAGAEALNSGIGAGERIPLVATSPVGFKDVTDQNKWTITGKSAVYPVFKTGPYSSWIRRPSDFKVFSYFTDSPNLVPPKEEL